MPNTWYIFVESIRNTYEAGGVVMFPILFAGVIGFYFLYSSWFRIGGDFFRKYIGKSVKILQSDLMDSKHKTKNEAICEALDHLGKRRGILARELYYAMQVVRDTPLQYRDYIQVRLIKTVEYMGRGNHIISVMAAAAPLLGLLGTVTGMVATFDVITLYGNQNPVLMADGISEALISTQSGLLIAFPLTLLKQRLDERVDLLKQQLELGATIIENFLSDGEKF